MGEWGRKCIARLGLRPAQVVVEWKEFNIEWGEPPHHARTPPSPPPTLGLSLASLSGRRVKTPTVNSRQGGGRRSSTGRPGGPQQPKEQCSRGLGVWGTWFGKISSL